MNAERRPEQPDAVDDGEDQRWSAPPPDMRDVVEGPVGSASIKLAEDARDGSAVDSPPDVAADDPEDGPR